MARSFPTLHLELPARHESGLRSTIRVADTVAQRVRDGYKLVLVPAGDERPDAMPDLSRALRPESPFSYLALRPHRRRRQLSFKGRRLTVGQLLARMQAEGWSSEEAAGQFELPIAAVDEAVEYGSAYATLIAAEAAEDAGTAHDLVHAVLSTG